MRSILRRKSRAELSVVVVELGVVVVTLLEAWGRGGVVGSVAGKLGEEAVLVAVDEAEMQDQEAVDEEGVVETEGAVAVLEAEEK